MSLFYHCLILQVLKISLASTILLCSFQTSLYLSNIPFHKLSQHPLKIVQTNLLPCACISTGTQPNMRRSFIQQCGTADHGASEIYYCQYISFIQLRHCGPRCQCNLLLPIQHLFNCGTADRGANEIYSYLYSIYLSAALRTVVPVKCCVFISFTEMVF